MLAVKGLHSANIKGHSSTTTSKRAGNIFQSSVLFPLAHAAIAAHWTPECGLIWRS